MRSPAVPPASQSWKLSDGYELRGRIWPPTAPRAAAVLYLHGIQSHGGWYEWSAARLAMSGMGVLLPDRRGSGLNTVARGDTPSVERWFADLDELAAWARTTWRAERILVVGVSWGGKLAAAWHHARPAAAQAMLLIAPGLFPAVDVAGGTKLQIALSGLVSPRKQFELPLNDPALFTDNPAGRAFIEQDTLKLTSATARFLLCSRKLDKFALARTAASSAVPLTLFLAGHDRIIRNEPTASWARSAGAPPGNVVTFPDAAHTLEFEPSVSDFGERLDDWVRCFAE